ncbi:MAG: glycine cleavage system protein GcvH [Phycisphaerales bacterium]|nr:glycine cleavage system protein GcvH [Phycisphaerales bacterium]
MSSPADLKYSKSHEWFRCEGNTITIGITKHAADELTDITFVEPKPVGTVISAGGAIGEVESVKTTSDVFSACGGTVVEVNVAAVADPSLVNSDPYGCGWLVKLAVADPTPLKDLLNAAAYDSANAGH